MGLGGVGKTRLALQIAARRGADFAQGAVFVPLAAVQSSEAVTPALAEALGFSFYGPTNPQMQFFHYLHDKQLLLILDNVEKLLDATPLFIGILQHAPAIKLLLTSREPLNVQGEWVYEVEGLQVPENDRAAEIEAYTAVQLFLQRAQRVRAGFALSAEDRSAVVRLCRLVNGIPLALELAASWIRTLSCQEIVQEIERNQDFLSASLRDLPERHRSLRAVFDQSWQMLAPEEQRVLRALSVFRGRFRREAAEHVASASLPILSALVAKSLLRRTDSGHYDLHELARQYAASQLAAVASEQRQVAERHSAYYLDWLERCDARLKSRRQKDTLIEMVAEADNLRAAWDWTIAQRDVAFLCQAARTLWHLFELRTWLVEGEAIFLNTAVALQSHAAKNPADAEEQVAVQSMRAYSAYFAFRLGKSAEAYTVLLPAATYLQSSADQLAAIYALWHLSIVCWELGKFSEADESLQVALRKSREQGQRWCQAIMSEFIGMVAYEQGRFDQSRQFIEEALAIDRELGDTMLIAHTLSYLSRTILVLEDYATAEKLLREGLALAREVEYRSGVALALSIQGQVVDAQAQYTEAHALFEESHALYREIGDLRNVSRVLNSLGHNFLALNDTVAAQEAFCAALRLAREGGFIPIALDALAGLAALWAQGSDTERALELAHHVLQHPAASHVATAQAKRIQTELAARLTPQQIEGARVRSFEAVVDQILESSSV